jgi:hypothetical protein
LYDPVLIPVFVLPALSEHGPEDTVTALPSEVPLDLLKVAEQSANPEVASDALNPSVTAEMYQPLLPAVPEPNPASVMAGVVVSILIVAVLDDPLAAPLLDGVAPSVAEQLTLWLPFPETVSVPLAVFVP